MHGIAILHTFYFVRSVADADIFPLVIILSTMVFVIATVVVGFLVVWFRCRHYCLVDVVTYQQERRRLRRHLKQKRGKTTDLMQYLQQRKEQLGEQEQNMNTMALYCAVSKELRTV